MSPLYLYEVYKNFYNSLLFVIIVYVGSYIYSLLYYEYEINNIYFFKATQFIKFCKKISFKSFVGQYVRQANIQVNQKEIIVRKKDTRNNICLMEVVKILMC